MMVENFRLYLPGLHMPEAKSTAVAGPEIITASGRISALYVLKGELRLETRDGAQSTRVLEGEAAGCLMNIIHRLIAGAEPVEALLFHAGVEGMPVGLGERGEMPDA